MQLRSEIIYQLALSGTLLFFVFTVVFVYTIVLYRKRRNEDYLKQQQQLLEVKNKTLRLVAAEQALTVNEIRADLQRQILPLVMFARMNLHEIEAMDAGGSKAQYVQNLISAIDNLTEKIRDYSYSVDSEYITDKGLCRLLEDEIDRVKESCDLDCFLDVSGDESLLTAEQKVMVLRIAIECIQNIQKHATANVMEIKLDFSVPFFQMQIIDDGTGFDLQLAEDNESAGIKAMHNRADLLGGQLDISTEREKGTHITLTIPLSENL